MDVNFCIKAMKRALASNPAPLVMNSDQGSQFTGQDWIGLLKQHRIRISMDGRGRAFDNIFVERLWRSLKYEEIYLNDYGSAALRAAGFTAMADEHAAAAAEQRTYADLMVELAAAKAGNDPVVLRDTKIKVAAYRETQRLFCAPRPGVINNFSEPSDAELVEAGY